MFQKHPSLFKIRNKLLKNFQRLPKFCQIGKISPNLVTLAYKPSSLLIHSSIDKHSMIVNFNSRVVITGKFLISLTSSVIYTIDQLGRYKPSLPLTKESSIVYKIGHRNLGNGVHLLPPQSCQLEKASTCFLKQEENNETARRRRRRRFIVATLRCSGRTSNVTRFGEILLLWQKIFVEGEFVRLNFDHTLVKIYVGGQLL